MVSEENRVMSVKVYIWETTSSNPGHASCEVNEQYISFWPTSETSEVKDRIKNPPGKGNLKDFKIGVDHEVSFPSSYRVDTRLERKQADITIELKGMNEELMMNEWRAFKKNPKRYNMKSYNCSTVVASFLELGSQIPYTHTPSINLKNYINDPKMLLALKIRFLGAIIQMWTPNDVKKYALQLKSKKG